VHDALAGRHAERKTSAGPAPDQDEEQAAEGGREGGRVRGQVARTGGCDGRRTR
jgi:hypothetical protein